MPQDCHKHDNHKEDHHKKACHKEEHSKEDQHQKACHKEDHRKEDHHKKVCRKAGGHKKNRHKNKNANVRLCCVVAFDKNFFAVFKKGNKTRFVKISCAQYQKLICRGVPRCFVRFRCC